MKCCVIQINNIINNDDVLITVACVHSVIASSVKDAFSTALEFGQNLESLNAA